MKSGDPRISLIRRNRRFAFWSLERRPDLGSPGPQIWLFGLSGPPDALIWAIWDPHFGAIWPISLENPHERYFGPPKLTHLGCSDPSDPQIRVSSDPETLQISRSGVAQILGPQILDPARFWDLRFGGMDPEIHRVARNLDVELTTFGAYRVASPLGMTPF